MKIGLYFGSFNPIHIGHLIIGSFVVNNTSVEQVWFVLSPQNPFKKSNSLLNEYHRLHMVQIAIEDDPQLRCSNVEFKLPKPSYTVDTLYFLSTQYPQHSFQIIIGSDSFSNITKWKNSKSLLENFNFLIYKRPGFDAPILSGNTTVLDAPLLEISSTIIRQLIRENKPIRYLVPERVREEIERNGYYRST